MLLLVLLVVVVVLVLLVEMDLPQQQQELLEMEVLDYPIVFLAFQHITLEEAEDLLITVLLVLVV